jgi:hypothetical protein
LTRRDAIDVGRRMSTRRGAADVVRDPSMRGATETTRESRMRTGIVAVTIAMSHVRRGAIDAGRRISMRRGAGDVARGPSRRGATETTRESPKRNGIVAVAIVMSHVTRGAIDAGRRMSSRRGATDVVKDPSMKDVAETTRESPKRNGIVAAAIAMSHETES